MNLMPVKKKKTKLWRRQSGVKGGAFLSSPPQNMSVKGVETNGSPNLNWKTNKQNKAFKKSMPAPSPS